MPTRKTKGKNFIIAYTLIAAIVLPYTQYKSYLNTVRVTRQQLHLNALRSQVLYLDNSLSLVSRSYILARDPQWMQHYNSLRINFNSSLSEINQLLPEGYEGKLQLMHAYEHVGQMEEKAFQLASSDQKALALNLLSSPTYIKEKGIFKPP